jgi:hypothetical protein
MAVFAFHPGAEQLVEMQSAKSVGLRLHYDGHRQSLHAIDVPARASALLTGFVQLCHGTQKTRTVQR